VSRIVAALSNLLEPAERECVCGDLEELRLRGSGAAANIIGLVVRRQLNEWSYWGPWVALLGIAGLAGYYLSLSVARVQTGIFLQIGTYLKYGVAYEPGGVSVAQNIGYTATLLIAMLLWSWACGFVLASLSGRALWMTSFLFYCVVQDSWAVHMALVGNIILKHGPWMAMLLRVLPLSPARIVFLLALALGILSARKGTLKRDTRLLLAVVGLTLVILLVWMENWFVAGFANWSGQPYAPAPIVYRVLPLLAAAWPVLSIPLLANRLHEPHEGRLAS
jgi:hypothetical protein